MEICYETAADPPESGSDRWTELRQLGESVESEWVALGQALGGRGRDPVRKWLGWALYRLAARVNPEIEERD